MAGVKKKELFDRHRWVRVGPGLFKLVLQRDVAFVERLDANLWQARVKSAGIIGTYSKMTEAMMAVHRQLGLERTESEKEGDAND